MKNESAFPNDLIALPENRGLTKRELFAAMAMQGICANQQLRTVPAEIAASWSIQQADALLAELAKVQT